MNMLQGTLQREDGRLSVALGDQELTLPQELLHDRPALQAYAGRELVVGIRPEDIEDANCAEDAPEDRRLRIDVRLREALGSEMIVHATLAAPPAQAEQVQELAAEAGIPTLPGRDGDSDGVGSGETTIVGRFSPRSSVREGAAAEVAVDTRRLHFFDPGTGLGVYDDTSMGGAHS
jgi:multiple sugar transport system ATP-binding protein